MMPEDSKLAQERLELASMVERLGRSKRLGQLLDYIGNSYFNYETEKLSEYRIATEVFGRSERFDPTEDAIARVEAHRLRKKLKEFYDEDGRSHGIRITLPPGSYTPRFVHNDLKSQNGNPTDLPSSAVEPHLLEGGVEAPYSSEAPPVRSSRIRQWWPLWLAVLFVTVGGALFFVNYFGHREKPSTPLVAFQGTTQSTSVLPETEGVRILCGYRGHSLIGPSNDTWLEDRDFHGGQIISNPPTFTARTNRPWMFLSAREGDFTYDVRLKPGTYELHLYFDETLYGPGLGGGEQSRTFSVSVNGAPMLKSFDIESDAFGPNIADERVFKDIQPASDGKLHLAFSREAGPALLNALAILPGTPHCLLPVRLVTQSAAVIDRNGKIWQPENYNFGGQSSYKRSVVTGTENPELYSMERFGHFDYAIPVALQSKYTLTLHFAELYFGSPSSGVGGVGSRVFRVMGNGVSLLENFDIFKHAGSLHAVVKTFRHIRPTAQGKMNVTFEPIKNYATVSAIEVVDEASE